MSGNLDGKSEPPSQTVQEASAPKEQTHPLILKAYQQVGNEIDRSVFCDVIMDQFSSKPEIPQRQSNAFIDEYGREFARDMYRQYFNACRDFDARRRVSDNRFPTWQELMACVQVALRALELLKEASCSPDQAETLGKTLRFSLFMATVDAGGNTSGSAMGPFLDMMQSRQDKFAHLRTGSRIIHPHDCKVAKRDLPGYLAQKHVALELSEAVIRRMEQCDDGKGPQTVNNWVIFLSASAEIYRVIRLSHPKEAEDTKKALGVAIQAVHARLRRLSLKELRQTSIAGLSAANSTIESDCGFVFTKDWMQRQIYTSRLSMALKGTQTPILKWRMEAVKELNDLTSHCNANQAGKFDRWLKNEQFRRMLFEEQDTIRGIFGHRMHTEVLKRAGGFLQLVARLGLWDASVGARVMAAAIKGDDELAAAAVKAALLGADVVLQQHKQHQNCVFHPVAALRAQRQAEGESNHDTAGVGPAAASDAKPNAAVSTAGSGSSSGIDTSSLPAGGGEGKSEASMEASGAQALMSDGAEARPPPLRPSTLPPPPSIDTVTSVMGGVSAFTEATIAAAAESARLAMNIVRRSAGAGTSASAAATSAPPAAAAVAAAAAAASPPPLKYLSVEEYVQFASQNGLFELEDRRDSMLSFLIALTADCYLDYDEADRVRGMLCMPRFDADLRLAAARNRKGAAASRPGSSEASVILASTTPATEDERSELEMQAKASGVVYAGGCRLPRPSVGEKTPIALHSLIAQIVKYYDDSSSLFGHRSSIGGATMHLLLCLYFRHVPAPAIDFRDFLGAGQIGLAACQSGAPLVGAATNMPTLDDPESIDGTFGNTPVEGIIGRHWGPHSAYESRRTERIAGGIRSASQGWAVDSGHIRAALQRVKSTGGRAAEYLEQRWWSDPRYMVEFSRLDDAGLQRGRNGEAEEGGAAAMERRGGAQAKQAASPEPAYPTAQTTAWPLSTTAFSARKAAVSLHCMQDELDHRIATPVLALDALLASQNNSSKTISLSASAATVSTSIVAVMNKLAVVDTEEAGEICSAVYQSCLASFCLQSESRVALAGALLLQDLPVHGTKVKRTYKRSELRESHAVPLIAGSGDGQTESGAGSSASNSVARSGSDVTSGTDESESSHDLMGVLSDRTGVQGGDAQPQSCAVLGGETMWWRSKQAFVHAMLRWWDLDSSDETASAGTEEAMTSSAAAEQSLLPTATPTSSTAPDGQVAAGSRKRTRTRSTRAIAAQQDASGSEEPSRKLARTDTDTGFIQSIASTMPNIQPKGRLPFATIFQTLVVICGRKKSTLNQADGGRIDDRSIDRLIAGMRSVESAQPQAAAACNDALVFLCAALLPEETSNGCLLYAAGAPSLGLTVATSPTAAVRLAAHLLAGLVDQPAKFSRSQLALVRGLALHMHSPTADILRTFGPVAVREDAATTLPVSSAAARRVYQHASRGTIEQMQQGLRMAGLRRALLGRCRATCLRNRFTQKASDVDGIGANLSAVIDKTPVQYAVNDSVSVQIGTAQGDNDGSDGAAKWADTQSHTPLDLAGVGLHFQVMLATESEAVASDAMSFIALLSRACSGGTAASATRRSLLRICIAGLKSASSPARGAHAPEDAKSQPKLYVDQLLGPLTISGVNLPKSLHSDGRSSSDSDSPSATGSGSKSRVPHQTLMAYLSEWDGAGASVASLSADSPIDGTAFGRVHRSEILRRHAEASLIAVVCSALAGDPHRNAMSRLVTLVRVLLMQTKSAALAEIDELGACETGTEIGSGSWGGAYIQRNLHSKEHQWLGDSLYGASRQASLMQMSLIRRDILRLEDRLFTEMSAFTSCDRFMAALGNSSVTARLMYGGHTHTIHNMQTLLALGISTPVYNDNAMKFLAKTTDLFRERHPESTRMGLARIALAGSNPAAVRRVLQSAVGSLGRASSQHRQNVTLLVHASRQIGSPVTKAKPMVSAINRVKNTCNELAACASKIGNGVEYALAFRNIYSILNRRHKNLLRVEDDMVKGKVLSYSATSAVETVGDVLDMVSRYYELLPDVPLSSNDTNSTFLDFGCRASSVQAYDSDPRTQFVAPQPGYKVQSQYTFQSSPAIRVETPLAHLFDESSSARASLYVMVCVGDIEVALREDIDATQTCIDTYLVQLKALVEGAGNASADPVLPISMIEAVAPLAMHIGPGLWTGIQPLTFRTGNASDQAGQDPPMYLASALGQQVEGTMIAKGGTDVMPMTLEHLWNDNYDKRAKERDLATIRIGMLEMQATATATACLFAAGMLGSDDYRKAPAMSLVSKALQVELCSQWPERGPTFTKIDKAVPRGKPALTKSSKPDPPRLDVEVLKALRSAEYEATATNRPTDLDKLQKRVLLESLASVQGLGGLRFEYWDDIGFAAEPKVGAEAEAKAASDSGDSQDDICATDRLGLAYHCTLGHSQLLQEYADGLDGVADTLLELASSGDSAGIRALSLDTLVGLLPSSAAIQAQLALAPVSVLSCISSGVPVSGPPGGVGSGLRSLEMADASSVPMSGAGADSRGRDQQESDASAVGIEGSLGGFPAIATVGVLRGFKLSQAGSRNSPHAVSYMLASMASLLSHSSTDPQGVFAMVTPLQLRSRFVSNGSISDVASVAKDVVSRMQSGTTLSASELMLLAAAMQCLLRFLRVPDVDIDVTANDPPLTTLDSMIAPAGYIQDPSQLIFGGLVPPVGLPASMLERLGVQSHANAARAAQKDAVSPGGSTSAPSSTAAGSLGAGAFSGRTVDLTAGIEAGADSHEATGWTPHRKDAAVREILGGERMRDLIRLAWKALLASASGKRTSYTEHSSEGEAQTGAKRPRGSEAPMETSSDSYASEWDHEIGQSRALYLEDEIAYAACATLSELLRLRAADGEVAIASPAPIVSTKDIADACKICGRHRESIPRPSGGHPSESEGVGPLLLPAVVRSIGANSQNVLERTFEASEGIFGKYVDRLVNAVDDVGKAKESADAERALVRLPYLGHEFLGLLERSAAKASSASAIRCMRHCLRFLSSIHRCLSAPDRDEQNVEDSVGADEAQEKAAADALEFFQTPSDEPSAGMSTGESPQDQTASADTSSEPLLPYTDAPLLCSSVPPHVQASARACRSAVAHLQWKHLPEAVLEDLHGRESDARVQLSGGTLPSPLYSMVLQTVSILKSVLPAAAGGDIEEADIATLFEVVLDQFVLSSTAQAIDAARGGSDIVAVEVIGLAAKLMAMPCAPSDLRRVYGLRLTAAFHDAMDDLGDLFPINDWTESSQQIFKPVGGMSASTASKRSLVLAVLGKLTSELPSEVTGSNTALLRGVRYPARESLRLAGGKSEGSRKQSVTIAAARDVFSRRPFSGLVAQSQQQVYAMENKLEARDNNSSLSLADKPNSMVAVTEMMQSRITSCWRDAVRDAALSVQNQAALMRGDGASAGLNPAEQCSTEPLLVVNGEPVEPVESRPPGKSAESNSSSGPEMIDAQPASILSNCNPSTIPEESKDEVRKLAIQLYESRIKAIVDHAAAIDEPISGRIGRFNHMAEPHPAASGSQLGQHTAMFPSCMYPRAASNYTGLINSGNHCYVLAVLQQLFMIPVLRHGTMRSAPLSQEAVSKHSHPAQLLRLRWEYQKLQGMMCSAPTKALDPHVFIQACRDIPRGWFSLEHPIEMQNDSNELLVRLVDRLGEAFPEPLDSLAQLAGGALLSTQPAPHAELQEMQDAGEAELIPHQPSGSENNLFAGTMEGQFCVELRGVDPDYPHYKSRGEKFLAVSLTIDKSNSVHEALQRSIEGDPLVDDNAYYCEKYDKKVDSERRQTFAQLPPVLCLHLNRFALSYETFERYKLFKEVEIPLVLDMWNYTLAGSLDAEKKKSEMRGEGVGVELDEFATKAAQLHRLDSVYRLQGIVIHRGTAVSGHYYSYIRERPEDAAAAEKGYSCGTSVVTPGNKSPRCGRWLRFDDDRVTEVDEETMLTDANGGQVVHKGKLVDRLGSAFMLMYDRMSRIEAETYLADVDSGSSPVAEADETELEVDSSKTTLESTNTTSQPQPSPQKRRRKSGGAAPEMHRSLSQASSITDLRPDDSAQSVVLHPLAPADVVRAVRRSSKLMHGLQWLTSAGTPDLIRMAAMCLGLPSTQGSAVPSSNSGAETSVELQMPCNLALLQLAQAECCSQIVLAALYMARRSPASRSNHRRMRQNAQRWISAAATVVRLVGVNDSDVDMIRKNEFMTADSVLLSRQLQSQNAEEAEECQRIGRDYLDRCRAAQEAPEIGDDAEGQGGQRLAVDGSDEGDDADAETVASDATVEVVSNQLGTAKKSDLTAHEGILQKTLADYWCKSTGAGASATASATDLSLSGAWLTGLIEPISPTAALCLGLNIHGAVDMNLVYAAGGGNSPERSVNTAVILAMQASGRAVSTSASRVQWLSQGQMTESDFLDDEEMPEIFYTAAAKQLVAASEVPRSVPTTKLLSARQVLLQVAHGELQEEETHVLLAQAIVASRATCIGVAGSIRHMKSGLGAMHALQLLPNLFASQFRASPSFRRVASCAAFPLHALQVLHAMAPANIEHGFTKNGWGSLPQQLSCMPFDGLLKPMSPVVQFDAHQQPVQYPTMQQTNLYLLSLAAGTFTDVTGMGWLQLPRRAVSFGDRNDEIDGASQAGPDGAGTLRADRHSDDGKAKLAGDAHDSSSKSSSGSTEKGVAKTTTSSGTSNSHEDASDVQMDQDWIDRHNPVVPPSFGRQVGQVASGLLAAEALRTLRLSGCLDGVETIDDSGNSSADQKQLLRMLRGYSPITPDDGSKRNANDSKLVDQTAPWLQNLGTKAYEQGIRVLSECLQSVSHGSYQPPSVVLGVQAVSGLKALFHSNSPGHAFVDVMWDSIVEAAGRHPQGAQLIQRIKRVSIYKELDQQAAALFRRIKRGELQSKVRRQLNDFRDKCVGLLSRSQPPTFEHPLREQRQEQQEQRASLAPAPDAPVPSYHHPMVSLAVLRTPLVSKSGTGHGWFTRHVDFLALSTMASWGLPDASVRLSLSLVQMLIEMGETDRNFGDFMEHQLCLRDGMAGLRMLRTLGIPDGMASRLEKQTPFVAALESLPAEAGVQVLTGGLDGTAMAIDLPPLELSFLPLLRSAMSEISVAQRSIGGGKSNMHLMQRIYKEQQEAVQGLCDKLQAWSKHEELPSGLSAGSSVPMTGSGSASGDDSSPDAYAAIDSSQLSAALRSRESKWIEPSYFEPPRPQPARGKGKGKGKVPSAGRKARASVQMSTQMLSLLEDNLQHMLSEMAKHHVNAGYRQAFAVASMLRLVANMWLSQAVDAQAWVVLFVRSDLGHQAIEAIENLPRGKFQVDIAKQLSPSKLQLLQELHRCIARSSDGGGASEGSDDVFDLERARALSKATSEIHRILARRRAGAREEEREGVKQLEDMFSIALVKETLADWLNRAMADLYNELQDTQQYFQAQPQPFNGGGVYSQSTSATVQANAIPVSSQLDVPENGSDSDLQEHLQVQVEGDEEPDDYIDDDGATEH